MHSNASTSAVGGFFALKYLLYLKFISHFHCLILVQPSLIHPQTIRTAFQLVPPSAHDPPFPIHPTYFVSGLFPKYHFHYPPQGRFSSSITSNPDSPPSFSILLLWFWIFYFFDLVKFLSTQAHRHLSQQFLGPLAWHILFPSAIKIQQVQDLPPTLSVSEVCCLANTGLLLPWGKALLSLWVVDSTSNGKGRGKAVVLQGNSWVLCPLFKNVTLHSLLNLSQPQFINL